MPELPGRDVHRGLRRAGPAGPGLGAGARRRGVPLPAPVHDRHRGRSSACSPPTSTSSCVIASPAGAYFPGGVKPVSIWLSEDHVRAVPGGMGDAKTGGNYAASLLAQAEAAAQGLRPGRLPRRGRAQVGRGAGRHEPVLRVRRPHRHPRPHRLASWRASPATPPHGRPRPRLQPPRRAASPSTSGAPTPRTAPSPRSSPAAPPPSSPRSAWSSRPPSSSDPERRHAR